MRLDVYISNHCRNCDEAKVIASLARDITGLEVRVVNLDESNHPMPARVVAVPTYLLNGRVVSLGNPDPARFLLGLAEQVREEIT